jgi:predicted permease
MGWWSRLARTFRPDRVNDELDEELASHLEEAIAHGRDPEEARRALGGATRFREASRDIRLLPWLDALAADVRFSSRQILKSPVTSAAAILSLGLAMGACLAACRIVDAVLFRPLPVVHPERLFELVRVGTDEHGVPTEDDNCEYPLFVRMRDNVRDRADLVAISTASPVDVFHGGGQDAEKAYRQFVSGTMFSVFGLRPALGRLLSADDDVTPGASPYAVLSYDYWTRRFGRDASAIGQTLRVGAISYQVIGVAPAEFTGTQPGVSVDFFVPTMMNPQVTRADASWFRAFVHLHAGVRTEDLIGPLRAVLRSFQEERAAGFVGLSPEYMRAFLSQTIVAVPAAAGVSFLQKNYARALAALAGFVALVLLIACANVSSLKIAQAAARSREMALRVSIGAGRGRLVQLMFVESTAIALAAAIVGAIVAVWAAPFIVSRLNPPANPITLALPIDSRIAVFSLALTCGVAAFFGLLPALRASRTAPVAALKGSSVDGARRHQLHLPVAGQAAFCALVLLVGGLFVSTFERLSAQPLGFSAERLIDLDTTAQPSQLPAVWNDLVADLKALPGVEAAAGSGWALLSGEGSSGFIWRNGAATTSTLAYFLGVTPGWIGVMKVPLVRGRDLLDTDRSTGVAIVNEAFAKEFFPDRDPIGQLFERQLGTATRPVYEIVGIVRNARYRNLREPMTPTAYIPLSALDPKGAPRPLAQATLVVRTSGASPATLAPLLRRVVNARSPFRVNGVQTQQEIDDAQTVRERLLATLAWFFSAVALGLTAIGVYGVMHYTVQQRQREIAIRRAIGAPGGHIVWRTTRRTALVLAAGTVAGLALGLVVVRSLTTLFYEVRATDVRQLVLPAMAVVVAGVIAAVPPVVRALRVNPTVILRGD